VTGEPMENVVVMGNWPGSHLEEVFTDEKGRFLIPAWLNLPDFGYRKYRESQVSINFFKMGFLPKSIHNNMRVEYISANGYIPEYVWQWNGNIIELQPLNDTWLEVFHEILSYRSKGGVRKNYYDKSEKDFRKEREYAYKWQLFDNDVDLFPIVNRCQWKSVPNLLIEIGKYLQSLESLEYEFQNKKNYTKMPLLEYIEKRFRFDPDKCHPNAREELQAFIDANSY
jgi:hypothetical protein